MKFEITHNYDLNGPSEMQFEFNAQLANGKYSKMI